MDIDNPVVSSFCNETMRPTADLTAGILNLIDKILSSAIGKGIPELLGTTSSKLMQQTEWTDADYAAIPVQNIVGSDSGGRNLLTNIDLLKELRLIVGLKLMVSAHPTLPAEIGKIAVNPRIIVQIQ